MNVTAERLFPTWFFVVRLRRLLVDLFQRLWQVQNLMTIRFDLNSLILNIVSLGFPGFVGIIGIYGLIVAVVIIGSVSTPLEGEYPPWRGFLHLTAGLATGLSGLAAGLSLGTIGEYGTRAFGSQPKLFAPMVLCLIFSEALAIYGLIIGLICATKNS